MNWILPSGSPIHFEGMSQAITVVRGLGSGTQGQVYEADYGDDRVAIKWYYPSCIERDSHLEQRLSESILATAPNSSFLWPIALLRTSPEASASLRLRDQSFGYMMPLRPPGFVGAHEHTGGHVDISIQNVVKTCFYLADAFHQLHLKGRCYKDISIGNLFMDPHNGRVLICDNDNVDIDGRELGSVLGTPGFMAPEIIMLRSKPSSNSDLFSLAVLIFRLLTRHDPLKGEMELQIRCLDEPARRRMYGEDPVYIFDPLDQRNRPNPNEHSAVLTTWPIYPDFLKKLFMQTFCDGMKRPERRALTGQWKQALSEVLNQRQLCSSCQQENFISHDSICQCWSCGTTLKSGVRLRMAAATVAAHANNELQVHHMNPTVDIKIDHPYGLICAHPFDPAIVGIKNLSTHTWIAELTNGNRVEVKPSKSCNLSLVQRLYTPEGQVELIH